MTDMIGNTTTPSEPITAEEVMEAAGRFVAMLSAFPAGTDAVRMHSRTIRALARLCPPPPTDSVLPRLRCGGLDVYADDTIPFGEFRPGATPPEAFAPIHARDVPAMLQWADAQIRLFDRLKSDR